MNGLLAKTMLAGVAALVFLVGYGAPLFAGPTEDLAAKLYKAAPSLANARVEYAKALDKLKNYSLAGEGNGAVLLANFDKQASVLSKFREQATQEARDLDTKVTEILLGAQRGPLLDSVRKLAAVRIGYNEKKAAYDAAPDNSDEKNAKRRPYLDGKKEVVAGTAVLEKIDKENLKAPGRQGLLQVLSNAIFAGDQAAHARGALTEEQFKVATLKKAETDAFAKSTAAK